MKSWKPRLQTPGPPGPFHRCINRWIWVFVRLLAVDFCCLFVDVALVVFFKPQKSEAKHLGLEEKTTWNYTNKQMKLFCFSDLFLYKGIQIQREKVSLLSGQHSPSQLQFDEEPISVLKGGGCNYCICSLEGHLQMTTTNLELPDPPAITSLVKPGHRMIGHKTPWSIRLWWWD